MPYKHELINRKKLEENAAEELAKVPNISNSDLITHWLNSKPGTWRLICAHTDGYGNYHYYWSIPE